MNKVSSKNKIALFMPALAGGGAEWVMLHLAKGFAAQGYTVDLVVSSYRGALTNEIPENINLINLDSSRIITSIIPFARYLRKAQPDVVLSALKGTNVVALLSHKLARSNARIFVSEHSTFSRAQENSSKLRDKLFPLLLKKLYPKANGIIAVSNGVKEDLKDQIGTYDKITTIYNPVVTPELKQKIKEPLNHLWFSDSNVKVIIGVGRLIKAKNFPLLINAFKKVHGKNNDARLVILGEGPQRPALERLVQELELKKIVLMPGFVDNPYKYMAQADCFVLSSNWEGFGNVVAEAMACGTPVVSTDCPSGPREILDDGKWGRLVSIEDADEMSSAISEVLNKSNYPEITQRAEDFRIDVIAARYLKSML